MKQAVLYKKNEIMLNRSRGHLSLFLHKKTLKCFRMITQKWPKIIYMYILKKKKKKLTSSFISQYLEK